jgi:ribosome production factor 2
VTIIDNYYLYRKMAPTEQQRKASKGQELSGGKKVPNARVQRYLKSTESKLRESGKSVLLLKGIKASGSMNLVLQELRSIQAPNVKLLSKKNEITAFGGDIQGQQSLEFLTTKNDCALFAMASHNKKRPNNLLIGRTFDRQLLDMAELGIVYFKSMKDYGGTVFKKRLGSKPLLLFVGDLWQQNADYRNLQNLFSDFYRGDVVQKLAVTGLDHIIVFTATDLGNAPPGIATTTLIHQRTYFCKLKKNPTDVRGGSKAAPVPHLEPCGPDFDYRLRRTMWAEPDLYKAARRQPQALRKAAKTKKNQSTNMFGETVGRLHVEKQNLSQGAGRKVKALRRAEKVTAEEEQAALDGELGREKEEMGQEFKKAFGFEENEVEAPKGRRGGKKK